jgi:tetratricopeptide (TPR) repeat protein
MEFPTAAFVGSLPGTIAGTVSVGGFSVAGTAVSESQSSGFGPASLLDLAFGTGDASDTSQSILAARYSGTSVSLPAAAVAHQENERSRNIVAAQTALVNDDYEEVRKVARQMLARDQSDAAANHLIARSYMAEQNYREAAHYFKLASDLAPDESRYADDFENAVILMGSDTSAIATATKMMKNPQKAAAGLRLLSDVADRSENPQTLMALGDALFSIKARQQALGAYFNGLDLADGPALSPLLDRANMLLDDSPDAAIAYKFLGDVYAKLGKHDEALSAYRSARDLAPTDGTYIIDLANAYNARGAERLAAGDTLNARADFREAKSLRPTNEDIKRNIVLAGMEIGRQLIARRALSSALAELNSARLDMPADDNDELKRRLAGLYYSLGNRYVSSGDRATAASTFQKAYDLSPNLSHKLALAESRFQLGMQYYDDEDYENALTQFEAAYDLVPHNQQYEDMYNTVLDLLDDDTDG